jgi:hypothetical protein
MRMKHYALMLIALAAPATAAAQQPDIALVYRLMLDGRAVITPAKAGVNHSAALGERLRGGDIVLTSENTRAAIRFTDDGSILRLNPSSKLQVRAEGDRNAITKTLNLEFGELWSKVNHKDGSQYRIQTPAGVAAVKGTEFIIRVGADGATTVITLEGVVEFFNGAGRTDVSAGRKTTVNNANQAPVAVATKPEDVKSSEALIKDEGSSQGDNESVEIEIILQNADGQARSVILVVPRRALKSVLEGGKQ